jgi:hypothetical protein
VVGGDAFEFGFGEELGDEFAEAFVELDGTAATVGEEEAAAGEVLFEAVAFLLVEGEVVAAMHVEDGVVEEIDIKGGEVGDFGAA